MDAKAPVVLFTFNRPEHTRATLESLARNAEFSASRLFIYCDGARNDAEASRVEEARRLVQEWPHPDKTVIERERNWGLANSIIDGVTAVCDAHGSVIVLEDDMVVSCHFLDYMNSGLERFRHDDRVISIHGYTFPVADLPEAYFIKGASCWGWATWKRGWDLFEADGRKLYEQLKRNGLFHRFDILGAYPYRRMLLDQINGRVDSWAVRWYASALIHDKLTLYPGRSLVHNTGLDGSGRHCDVYDGFAAALSTSPIDLEELAVVENTQALEAWRKYLKSVRKEKLVGNLLSLRKIGKFLSQRMP